MGEMVAGAPSSLIARIWEALGHPESASPTEPALLRRSAERLLGEVRLDDEGESAMVLLAADSLITMAMQLEAAGRGSIDRAR